MVAWSSGYSGGPFKFKCGMTQGNPLSPMIFNVVVDAVLHHWVSVVAEADGEVGPEVFGQYMQRMAAYFYADDGIILSMSVARLQRAFDILTDLFDWVDL